MSDAKTLHPVQSRTDTALLSNSPVLPNCTKKHTDSPVNVQMSLCLSRTHARTHARTHTHMHTHTHTHTPGQCRVVVFLRFIFVFLCFIVECDREEGAGDRGVEFHGRR